MAAPCMNARAGEYELLCVILHCSNYSRERVNQKKELWQIGVQDLTLESVVTVGSGNLQFMHMIR